MKMNIPYGQRSGFFNTALFELIAIVLFLNASCARIGPPTNGIDSSLPLTASGLTSAGTRDYSNGREEEEREATGAVEAARQRRQMRQDSTGDIPPNALLIAKELADVMEEMTDELTRDAGIGGWEWLGPSNVGGRIRAIAIHPTTPQTMWAGGVGGGIWKTTNGGQSWTPLNDFLASLAITSIVIDPTNAQTMYVSTGEVFYGGGALGTSSGLPGAGIFKSVNGGATWSQLVQTVPAAMNLTDPWAYVTRLAHHPTLSGTVFACTQTGVWRTQNGGTAANSWQQVLPGVVAYDVKINPANPAQVLAGTLNATDTNGIPVYGGVFFSASSGNTGTWTDQSLPLAPPNQGNPRIPAVVGACEVAWGASSTMWVSASRNNGEVWRSTDAGLNWTLRNTGTQYITQAGTHAIWVAPDNANLVVVGGLDLWRSTDAGQTFTRISDWTQYHTNLSAHADQHIIISPPDYNASSRRVYVGNDGGIQMAQNIFTTTMTTGWTRLVTGLGITQFYGGAVYPGGDRIFGGTQDNSVLRRHGSQGPDEWYQANTGDGTYCAVVPGLPLIAYSAWQNLDFIKSTNGGDSWSRKKEGLEDANANPQRTLFIAPFVIDPNDHQILVAGGQSIYRTTDGADFWDNIRDEPTSTALCSAIEIAKGNSQNIWVGYNNGRVSCTNGTSVSTWSDVQANGLTPIPAGRYVTDIAINPQNSSEVLVTVGGYSTDTVWFTSDSGANWQNRNGTLPNQLPSIQINTIRFHPLKPNYIYVGTDLGIFASQDRGLTWNRVPSNATSQAPGVTPHDGPANVEVDELFWDNDMLYAATHGRGMYRTRPVITDCLAWTQLSPAGTPSSRYSHAMVYDSDRHVVVLFGGGTGATLYGDTWEFDGTTWVNRGVSNGPSPRSGHAMAYDRVRQRTVLFGGRDANNFFDDTWEWDGVAGNWIQRTPANKPAARYLHAMAFEAANNRILLYGGSQNQTGFFDTWRYDPEANGGAGNWIFLNDAATSPDPHPTHCQGHAMAYHPPTQRVIMAGGTSPNFADNTNTTWEWNPAAPGGARWTPLPNLPNYTYRPTMAYDSTRQRMRLYGGSTSGDNSGFNDHTYELDVGSWILVGTGAPPARTDPVMVYDSFRDKTILFGGRVLAGNNFGDTWALTTSRPNITTQEQCGMTLASNPLTISVTATGSEPLTYQWHKIGTGDLTDDGRITGTTTSTLSFNPTQLDDTGDYRCTITDRCNGSTPSATINVVIHSPLVGGNQLTAFGQNSWAQLGRGTTCGGSNCDTRIREVDALGNVVQVSGSVGGFHVLALRSDRRVYSWGANSYGQIGNGTVQGPMTTTPFSVPNLTDVMAVAAGGEFSLALKTDGTVWGWGQNWSYALGNATTIATALPTPTQLPDLSCVIAIAAGVGSSFALKADGSVWSWGANSFGQLGIGSMTPNQIKTPQAVLNLGGGVIQLSAGMGHVLALKSDGTVWSWGYNNAGQTGDGTLVNRTVPAQVAGLSNIVKVRAGQSHSLALRNDGVVLGWGINGSGELGRGHINSPILTPAPVLTSSGLTSVSDIAAGFNHSVFLGPNGTVWTTGFGVAETGYPTPTNLGTPIQVTRILFPCVSVDTAYLSTFVRHAPTPPLFDPILGGQPMPQGAIEGGLIKLTSVPYGTPTLQHIWYRNGNSLVDDGRITGAWTPNVTINPAQLSDAGNYHLRVDNFHGQLFSSPVGVTVESSPFCDEFSGAPNPLWGHEVGTWQVSGGQYYSSSNTYSSLPFELADFSVDVDISAMASGGIWLRTRRCTLSPTGNNCSPQDPGFSWIHGVQLWHSGGSLMWHAYINGSVTAAQNTVNNAYTVGSNVHLRVEVIGNIYKVFVNGSMSPATQFNPGNLPPPGGPGTTPWGLPSGRFALNDYSGPTQKYERVCINGTPIPMPDGNMNGDAGTDGKDVAPFVGAVIAGGNDPAMLAHGDFNGNGVMDPGDAGGMVNVLLDE